MKANRSLIVCVILGFGCCYFLMQQKKSTSIVTSSDELSSISENSKLVRSIAPNKPLKVTIHSSKEVADLGKVGSSASMQKSIETDSSIDNNGRNLRREIELTITEDDIVNLEAQWNDLHHQVEAIREPKGWRIKWIMPESILATAGLREGDFLKSSSLAQIGSNLNDPNIANRFANILNRISVR